MSQPAYDEMIKRLTSKPKRIAIIRLIGERGEASFKELKQRMNIGVGTLYYHLDGLSNIVAQNSSRQYVLTEQGKKVYDSVKNVELVVNPRTRGSVSSTVPSVLREVLFLESHVEKISQDQMSSVSITVGILFMGSILAALLRIEPAIFFLRSRTAPPWIALYSVLISWLVILGVTLILTALLWKVGGNIVGVAAGSALSLVPVMFAMLLDGLRRTFQLALLNYLFSYPYFLAFQILLVIWSAFLLTISLRSAVNLSIEKALVVTLIVVLINFVYLWANPFVLPVLK